MIYTKHTHEPGSSFFVLSLRLEYLNPHLRTLIETWLPPSVLEVITSIVGMNRFQRSEIFTYVNIFAQ